MYSMRVFLLATAFFLSGARGDYGDGSSPVKVLDASSFDNAVANDGVSLVQFLDDTFDSSNFYRQYETIATCMKDVVNVYAVKDSSVMARFGISSFPSFKVFLGRGPSAKPDVVNYNGKLAVPDLVTFTMKNVNIHVNKKVRASIQNAGPTASTGKVISLTDAEFERLVVNDRSNQWLILFYAPWCRHCKAFHPEWARMAQSSGKVKVGSIDATVYTALAARYGVKGFPTIFLFPQGVKSPTTAIRYKGPRKAEDILQFAKSYYRNMGPPVKVDSVSDLKQRCSRPLCLLFFIPETSMDEHLSTISLVMEKHSSLPFEFCYTTAGRHPQWERVLGVYSTPAVFALNLSKNVYSVMRKEKLTFVG
uniref:Protein disulfide isomerase related protein n=1 Tax=Babesia bovis TaxID=5865 RepID=S6BH01_BABBO|nr:protein disulfide isomerase related protein [Babesia bovis]